MSGDRRRASTAMAVAFAMTPGSASAGVQPLAGIAATAVHASGPTATYPRLVEFPDPKVMARVNSALAAREASDRSNRNDCYAQLRDQKQGPRADSYSEDITLSYLSRRFLSVNVVVSYDCAAAYPTNGEEEPMTFDLDSGSAVDWTALFKPGFLSSEDTDAHAPQSVLTTLYRARYRPGATRADDCMQVVTSEDPFAEGATFWLDAKRGLVVQPDFPHVIAACADEMVLSVTDVGPYLKVPALADDLRTSVNPRRP